MEMNCWTAHFCTCNSSIRYRI